MTVFTQQEAHQYLDEYFDEPQITTWDRFYSTVPKDFIEECVSKAGKHQFWNEASWTAEVCDCNFWALQFVAFVQRQWVRNYNAGKFNTKCKPMIGVWIYELDDAGMHADVTFTYTDDKDNIKQGFVVAEPPLMGKPSLREIRSCTNIWLP